MAIINDTGLEGRDDLLGFTFNGRHSSEFRFIRVSGGKEFESELLPNRKDTTINIPGQMGEEFLYEKKEKRTFKFQFAFDDMNESDIREIKNWLSVDYPCDLVLDEEPYKTWKVKVSGIPKIKYNMFDREDGSRVYKGTGDVQFVAFKPYARCSGDKKFLSAYPSVVDDRRGPGYNIDQWKDTARLLDGNPYIEYKDLQLISLTKLIEDTSYDIDTITIDEIETLIHQKNPTNLLDNCYFRRTTTIFRDGNSFQVYPTGNVDNARIAKDSAFSDENATHDSGGSNVLDIFYLHCDVNYNYKPVNYWKQISTDSTLPTFNSTYQYYTGDKIYNSGRDNKSYECLNNCIAVYPDFNVRPDLRVSFRVHYINTSNSLTSAYLCEINTSNAITFQVNNYSTELQIRKKLKLPVTNFSSFDRNINIGAGNFYCNYNSNQNIGVRINNISAPTGYNSYWNVYNAGDLPTQSKITLSYTNNSDYITVIHKLNNQDPTTKMYLEKSVLPSVTSDSPNYLTIDNNLHLILETTISDSTYIIENTVLNKALAGGDFFKIPPSADKTDIQGIGVTGASIVSIDYDYLYY